MAVSFLLGPSGLYADPANDCNISGTLKINGQDAPVGCMLTVWIESRKILTTTTTKEGWYSLTVPRYDPANPDQAGYESEDDVVVVKVDGRTAEPTINPKPGSYTINLEVNTTLNVKLTTWGKIKALFK